MKLIGDIYYEHNELITDILKEDVMRKDGRQKEDQYSYNLSILHINCTWRI